MKKILTAFIFLFLFGSMNISPKECLVTPDPIFRSGKDYALFFAVQDYNEWPDLRNPIKDAETIADDLEKWYGFSTEVVKNPNKLQILQKLEAYRKKQYEADGQLFIFFTGHGTFTESTKEGFFIPKDGKVRDSFQDSYIAHTRLERAITTIPCRHILLAIDACFSGTFDDELALDKDMNRPGENESARQRFIERTLSYPSRLYLTSGGKERTSDGVEHSPFTKEFLEALRDFGGKDQILDFDELKSYMKKASQPPRFGVFEGHKTGGDFLFVADDRIVKGSGHKLPSRHEIETQAWIKADGAGTRIAYEQFLVQFPNGQFKDLARDKLKNMRKVVPGNMVFVRGGSFSMGCTSEHGSECEDDEKPLHNVILSDFLISSNEVTFADYDDYCIATVNNKPSDHGWGRGKYPVVNVSWEDAVSYCNWLSDQHKFKRVYEITDNTVTANWNANGYRLPTEAEWEYAARDRGKISEWAGTSSESNLASFANYYESGRVGKDGHMHTAMVGSFIPNSLGLFDMSGNVWEWCWDWYDDDYYKNSTRHDPKGPDRGNERVLRGGSWYFGPNYLRCTIRSFRGTGYKDNNVGFRVVRSAD